jgi:hypothetical protein
MNDSLNTRPFIRQTIVWVAGLGLAGPGIWLIVVWVDRAVAAGAGWLLVTGLILVTGILAHIYQQRRNTSVGCSTRPRLSPLQISSLAAEALGVQLLWQAGSPEFAAVLPLLTWSGWPYTFIAAGLLGLAWSSLSCDSRGIEIRG